MRVPGNIPNGPDGRVDGGRGRVAVSGLPENPAKQAFVTFGRKFLPPKAIFPLRVFRLGPRYRLTEAAGTRKRD